jgi:hypothetical protein
MLHTSRFALPMLFAGALALAGPAGAQDAKTGTASPPAKAAAAPGKAATTPATAKKAPTKPLVPPTTQAEEAVLASADADQLSAAERVHYGEYVCDDKFKVHVERNAKHPGYVSVRYLKDTWVMKPVGSVTGAVRLEDTRGQVLLVQIPTKSMLLNTKTGQRMIDSCVHEAQRTN